MDLKKTLLIGCAVVLLLAVAFVIGVYGTSNKSAVELAAKKPLTAVTPVLTNAVERRRIKKIFTTPANLEAWKQINLFPMKDARVEIINFSTGDKVEAGDDLAYLSSESQKLKKRLADIELNLQQREYEIAQRLARKNFVSKRELEEKTLRLESRKLRQRIEDIESSKTTIKSPIKGVLAEVNIREGDYISDPTKHNILVMDPEKLKISIFLSQKIAQVLNYRTPIRVVRKDTTGITYADAVIDSISPVVDKASGTIKTELIINNFPTSWRPGMFVQVEITILDRPDSIAIPNEALAHDDQGAYIFAIMEEESKIVAEKVRLETGATDGQYTEIITDLDAYDEVVIQGQGTLNDGSLVKVVETP